MLILPVCVNGQANKTVTKDANNDDADEQREHQDVMWTQEKFSGLKLFFPDQKMLWDIIQIWIHLGYLAQWTWENSNGIIWKDLKNEELINDIFLK